MNKKQCAILGLLTLAIVVMLLIPRSNSQEIYVDSVEISLMHLNSDLWLIQQEYGTYTYPFIFNPKALFLEVTDLWLTYELNVGQGRNVQYNMNGIAAVSESLPTTTDETYYVKQITSQSFLDAVTSGINHLVIALPNQSNPAQLNYLTILIEYEYQATTLPALAEVPITEVLMILGLGLVVLYNVYVKMKPKFHRQRGFRQDPLPGYA